MKKVLFAITALSIFQFTIVAHAALIGHITETSGEQVLFIPGKDERGLYIEIIHQNGSELPGKGIIVMDHIPGMYDVGSFMAALSGGSNPIGIRAPRTGAVNFYIFTARVQGNPFGIPEDLHYVPAYRQDGKKLHYKVYADALMTSDEVDAFKKGKFSLAFNVQYRAEGGFEMSLRTVDFSYSDLKTFTLAGPGCGKYLLD